MLREAAIFEDNPFTVMDRIFGNAATPITIGTISTIAYRVWEYETYEDMVLAKGGVEVGASANLTVASVVFDTYQIDAYWTSNGGDATGYNFRFTFPPARFPSGNKWYRVEITFTPASGDAFKIVWAVHTTSIASS